MMVAISISPQHLQELENIAKECHPTEACALLEGKIITISDKSDDEKVKVLGILRMQNADESIYSFRIDSIDLIRAYQEISSRNREVVGIFHSHSSMAYPSLTDRKYMELNPVVWLIYSTLSHSFGAYMLDEIVMRIKLEYSLS